MIEHTVHAYDADLAELAGKIGEMGDLVKKQLVDAIGALAHRNLPLAKSVIATDDQVDALQRFIEEKAIVTIARRQPMAVDLREIVGALRISNDLERVGDLAENIAKRILLMNEEARINEVILQIQRMVQLVLDQLARVLQSYRRRDVTKAIAVWERDQEVDALNSSLFRELLTYMMEKPSNITFCTHLLFCAKNIERIGDHATNIAETVYYIVQGQPLHSMRPKADITSIGALGAGGAQAEAQRKSPPADTSGPAGVAG